MMTASGNYLAITLAALLHDIGKVGQRAHTELEGLSEGSRGLIEYLCPAHDAGFRTHLHVLYTNEFCERVLSQCMPNGLNISDIANLAAYHHRPQSGTAQELITIADHLSSSIERGESQPSAGRSQFRATRLTPIVARVSDNVEKYESMGHVYPVRPLTAATLFPVEKESDADPRIAYLRLWENLERDVVNISITDPVGFTNTLLMILEQHLWAVPSATNVLFPDIPLFDHLRSTAAIAACLAVAGETNKPFRLVSGDLGGIQAHIFGLQSGAKGFARALRGRSYLVSALSDFTAMGVLYELGLPLTNLLISAGGHFLLLLPNTDESMACVQETETRIHEWLLDQQHGQLGFSIATCTASRDELGSDFTTIMQELGERLTRRKLSGLIPLQADGKWDTERWLLPMFTGQNADMCPSCRARMVEVEGYGGQERVCETCMEDRQIGQGITKTSLINVRFGGPAAQAFRHGLPGTSFGFSQEGPWQEDKRTLSIKLKLPDEERNGQRNITHPTFRVLRNFHVPLDSEGSVIELSDIAAQSEGLSLLGYLKADVDDLGYLFSQGFRHGNGGSDERTSISKFIALSRSLEYFFSGYLGDLLHREFPYTYTVFSGGDDLLFIGPWDQTLALATRLREDFRRYTCLNPVWGISAGFAMGRPKSPVSHLLREVDRNLRTSKDHPGKDSITAMGSTMAWDEFNRSLLGADRVVEWIKDGTLNPAKVHRLHGYAQQLAEFRRSGNASLLTVIPMMIYDLARNWGDKTENERQAKRWAQMFTNPEHADLPFLSFICQYAINRTRKGSAGDVSV